MFESNKSATVYPPFREHDVLLGPGYQLNANRQKWYLPFLLQHADAYQQCLHSQKQHFVVHHIIHPIHAMGGRFLQRQQHATQNHDAWEYVDDDVVVLKVMQALRDIHKRKGSTSGNNCHSSSWKTSDSEQFDNRTIMSTFTSTKAIVTTGLPYTTSPSGQTSVEIQRRRQEENTVAGKQEEEEQDHCNDYNNDNDILSEGKIEAFHRETLQPALDKVQNHLEKMQMQLHIAYQKIEDLLSVNMSLEQENRGLRTHHAVWLDRERLLMTQRNEGMYTLTDTQLST